MPKGSSSKSGTNKPKAPAKEQLTKHDSPPSQPDDDADSLQTPTASRPTRVAKQHLLENPTWERRRNAFGKKRRNSSDSTQGDPEDQVSAKKRKTDSAQKRTRSTAFRAPKLTVDSADSASDDGGQFTDKGKQNLGRKKANGVCEETDADEDEADIFDKNAHKKRDSDSDSETGSGDKDTSGSETEESDHGEFASMSRTAHAVEIPTWTDNGEQREMDKDDSQKEKRKRKRTHLAPPNSPSDSDDPEEAQPNKDAAKTKQAPKKREEERAWEKRAAEEPSWKEEEDDKPGHGGEHETKDGEQSARKTSAPKPDSDSDSTGDADNIELIYPPSGRKWSELPITTQHPRVRKVADRANQKVHVAILSDEAFPDGTTAQTRYARKALLDSAKELGYTDIYTRLKNDTQYAHDLGTIPAQRISTYRGPVKKSAAKVVESQYGLKTGCAQKVQWLLQSCHYVFPCDVEKLKHDGSKPYRNEALVSVLRQEYFTGEPSFAVKHPELFKSSLPDKAHERELPRAMVALAATAIGSCLRDWQSGVPPTKWSDFRGDGNITLYNANIRTIERIKANSLAKYHKMMHDLYVILTNSEIPAPMVDENDEDAVDYDAMSE